MRTECRCGHLNLTLDSFYAAGTRTLGLYQSWCKIPFQNVYPRTLPSTTNRHSPCIQFFYQINWNSIRCVLTIFFGICITACGYHLLMAPKIQSILNPSQSFQWANSAQIILGAVFPHLISNMEFYLPFWQFNIYRVCVSHPDSFKIHSNFSYP